MFSRTQENVVRATDHATALRPVQRTFELTHQVVCIIPVVFVGCRVDEVEIILYMSLILERKISKSVNVYFIYILYFPYFTLARSMVRIKDLDTGMKNILRGGRISCNRDCPKLPIGYPTKFSRKITFKLGSIK